jgi:hypothetical protein
MEFSECEKHREMVVRYGPRHPVCPVCKVTEIAREPISVEAECGEGLCYGVASAYETLENIESVLS